MGWCGCCDLSKLACKHVVIDEKCRATLKKSSWVGLAALGIVFKCGHQLGERKHHNKQPKVCPGLQGKTFP